MIEASELLSLPLLIAIGAAVYLGSVHLIDRGVWIDVRRLVAAVRA